MNLNGRGIIRLNMAMKPMIHLMATIEPTRGRGVADERRERANAHDQARDIKQRKKHHMSKAKPESEATDKQFPERLRTMRLGPHLSPPLRDVTRRRVRGTRRVTATALSAVAIGGIMAMVMEGFGFHCNAIENARDHRILSLNVG